MAASSAVNFYALRRLADAVRVGVENDGR